MKKIKKFITVLLSAVLVLSTSNAVFAEDNTTSNLTEAQKIARQKFTSIYMDKMNQIVDLRIQTKEAVEKNNALTAQIKEKLKNQASMTAKDKIEKLKQLRDQSKELQTQARDLNKQRGELKKQYNDSVKKRDKAAMEKLQAQINDLTSKIEQLRQQIKTNNDLIKPIAQELKTYQTGRKDLKSKVKPLLDQAKELHKKIASEEQAKNKLWETYKTNIQAKDYDAAIATLDQIIAAKKQILSDIQGRTTIINNILSIIG